MEINLALDAEKVIATFSFNDRNVLVREIQGKDFPAIFKHIEELEATEGGKVEFDQEKKSFFFRKVEQPAVEEEKPSEKVIEEVVEPVKEEGEVVE